MVWIIFLKKAISTSGEKMNEPWIPNSPYSLKWHKGELPGADLVPYGCNILAWVVWNFEEDCPLQGKFKRIVLVEPWKNIHDGNWCWLDAQISVPPFFYQREKVAYWAYAFRPDGNPTTAHNMHQ